MKKILPPYAKSIPKEQSCIVICTGSKAWDKAKSNGWLNPLKKTLLPLNDDIARYQFNFTHGKDVVLFSHGILESYDRLTELSRAILAYSALKVLWCIPQYPTNKFIAKEALYEA